MARARKQLLRTGDIAGEDYEKTKDEGHGRGLASTFLSIGTPRGATDFVMEVLDAQGSQ